MCRLREDQRKKRATVLEVIVPAAARPYRVISDLKYRTAAMLDSKRRWISIAPPVRVKRVL